MDFLNHLKDYVNIQKYYNKLNKFDNNDYKNIINYLNIQWSKILLNIDDEFYSNIKISKINTMQIYLIQK